MRTPQHDSPIGPATRLAQTNFQVSGRPVQLGIVRALVLVKQAMARANAQRTDDSGVDAPMADAIGLAADEVLRGDWDDLFTIDTFQTGSGTSTNMNTYLPVIADNLLSAISLLGRAAGDFGVRCVRGIGADRERCRAFAMASPALAAALDPLLGYDVATQLVRRAEAEHRPLREVVVDSGLLEPSQVESAFDVDAVARGAALRPAVPGRRSQERPEPG